MLFCAYFFYQKSGMGVSLTPKGRFELPQWIFLLFSMTEAPNATMNSLAIRSIIGLLTFYEESDFLWKVHEVIINSQNTYSKTLAKRVRIRIYYFLTFVSSGISWTVAFVMYTTKWLNSFWNWFLCVKKL